MPQTHQGDSRMTRPLSPRQIRSPESPRDLLHRRLRAFPVYAAILISTWIATARAPADNPTTSPATVARADWLKWAPGDARLFIEFRDLAGVRSAFRTRGIWEAVQQLSAPAATTQPWQLHAERSLGLTPDQAIDELLGARAALLAVNPANWQVGVVIAELPPQTEVRTVLRRWRARPEKPDGPVQRYSLPGGLGLAIRGRVLMFGPKEDPEGLWDRSAALLADRAGPTLAGRSDVAALRAAAPQDYSCLIYTSWTDAAPSEDPRSNRLLCTATVTADGIDCELRGHVRPGDAQAATWTAAELAQLPGDVAFLWARSHDAKSIHRWLAVDGLPVSSLSGMLFQTFVATPEDRRRVADSLGPRIAWIGDVRPGRTRDEAVMPAVSVVCDTRDATFLSRRIDAGMDLLTAFLEFISGQPASQESTFIQKTPLGKETMHWVDWSKGLVARVGLPALATVQPCWVALDGRLVFASTRSLAQRIIESRADAVMRMRQKRIEALASDTPITDYFRVDGQKIAALIHSWDGYLSRHHAEVLTPNYWREWTDRRIEERRRLGVTLKAAPDGSGAEVVTVDSSTPAEGRLEPGDIIIEAGGRPTSTSRPAQVVAEAYQASRETGAFALVFMRGTDKHTILIPLPTMPRFAEGFDPVAFLRRLASLSSRIDSITAIGRMGPGPRIEVRAQMRWKRSGGLPTP